MDQYADYDELKRELDIMKVLYLFLVYLGRCGLRPAQYVEFAGLTLDEEDLDDSVSIASDVRMPDPNADKANKARGKPLENLLMSKNRKLQDQLTSLRVRLPFALISTPSLKQRSQVNHDEIVESTTSLQAELEAAKTSLDEQRSLNERLENDLLRINRPSDGDVKVDNTSATRSDPLASLNLGRKVRSALRLLRRRGT